MSQSDAQRDTTPNLNLPYIQDGQALKHITHNEALIRLDSLVQMTISGVVPKLPANAELGTHYLLSADSTDGQADQILVRRDTGWEALHPQSGWRVWDAATGELRIFHNDAWQVFETGTGNTGGGTGGGTPYTHPETLDILGINATPNTDNRLVVSSPATLLNHEGNGHQLKINKASPADTASLLFQTGFGGRAEMGLAGEDSFSIKVSSDGSTFHTAIQISSDGQVEFPQNADAPFGPTTAPDNSEDDDLFVAPMDKAGGTLERIGPMSAHTLALGREALTLTANRIYMSAFFVDRERTLRGAVIAQHKTPSSTGNLIRAGLFSFGSPDGDGWRPGDLIADYGTQPADRAGHKRFDLEVPITLSRGWYLHAVGTQASGVVVRSAKWLTPGLANYMSYGSDGQTDIRPCGPSRYLQKNNMGAEISTGFPTSWTEPFDDIVLQDAHTSMCLLPIWQFL